MSLTDIIKEIEKIGIKNVPEVRLTDYGYVHVDKQCKLMSKQDYETGMHIAYELQRKQPANLPPMDYYQFLAMIRNIEVQ